MKTLEESRVETEKCRKFRETHPKGEAKLFNFELGAFYVMNYYEGEDGVDTEIISNQEIMECVRSGTDESAAFKSGDSPLTWSMGLISEWKNRPFRIITVESDPELFI